MKKFFKYFRDAVKELSFVTWPKRDTLVRHATVVLSVTLVFALAFWLIDGGMRFLIAQYIVVTEPFHGTGTVMTSSGATATTTTTPVSNVTVGGSNTDGVQVQSIPVTDGTTTVPATK